MLLIKCTNNVIIKVLTSDFNDKEKIEDIWTINGNSEDILAALDLINESN